MSDWQALLAAAVKRSTCAAVARELGVSRAAVSTAVRGCYPGRTDRIAARVIAAYGDGSIHCPFLDDALRVPECRSWQERPQPTSDPRALKHWIACRTCPVGAGVRKLAQATAAPAPAAEPAPAPVEEPGK